MFNERKVKEYNFIIDEVITTYFTEFRNEYYEDMVQEGYVGLLNWLADGGDVKVESYIRRAIAKYLNENILIGSLAPLTVKSKYLKAKELMGMGFSYREALEEVQLTDLEFTDLELGITHLYNVIEFDSSGDYIESNSDDYIESSSYKYEFI